MKAFTSILTVNIFLHLIPSISYGQLEKVPQKFSDLATLLPSVRIEVRYASSNNFIGKPIDGYKAAKIFLTNNAIIALEKVQDDLRDQGLGLKVYDGYRPQRAVDQFVRWSQRADDTLMKAIYYPYISKHKLFTLGYIAAKSGHSRGSTVDLTLVNLSSGKELDMGSHYDYFGTISGVFNKTISEDQLSNRLLLRNAMLKNGFKALSEEWWHFTLKKEPYPNTYFDFVIE